MGLSLSEPITTKTTDVKENEQYKIGVSCMQGWRIDMEDDHTIEIDYLEDPKSCFLAVFDGHGGSNVAKFSASNLFEQFPKEESYKTGDFPAALKKSFLNTDVKMLKDDKMQDDTSGATAVVVFVKGNKVYCANAGDSRAILSERGNVFELSYDHKPNNPTEHQRINKAGGYVEFNRVNGNLALSRALGDFTYKLNDALTPENQIVTADPDIIEKEIGDDDEFIVLACDGIWDCMTNEEVLEYVRIRLAKGILPHIICEDIMDNCLANEVKPGGVGCDNMSVIITCLLKGKTFEEFCAGINKTLEKPVDLEFPVTNSETMDSDSKPIQPNTPLTVVGDQLNGLLIKEKKSPIEENDEDFPSPDAPIPGGKQAEIMNMLNGDL